MVSLGDHMKNVCHHFKDYVCQTSEYFQIWKAIQIRLLGMDAVESEGASQDPSAKLCSTQTLPSSHKYQWLCLFLLCSVSSKRKVRPLNCNWSSQPFSLWLWLPSRQGLVPSSSLLLSSPTLPAPMCQMQCGLLGRLLPPWGSRPESASPFLYGVS